MTYLRSIGCLLLLFLCTFDIKAQTGTSKVPEELQVDIGGLYEQKQFPGLKPADTAALIVRINASLSMIARNTDSAQALLTETLQKSLHLHYDCGIAASLTNLAAIKSAKGQYESSLYYYRLAESFAIKGFRNRTSLAMFYSCMSAPFFYLSRYDSMYHYTEKASGLIKGIRCRNAAEAMDVSGIYNNIGMLWEQVGDLKKAQLNMNKAIGALLPFSRQPSLQHTLSQVYSNLALLSFDRKDYDSASQRYRQALSYSRNNPGALINLAKIATYHKQYQEAIGLLRETIVLTERSQSYIHHLNAKAVLGKIYYDLGRQREAEKLFTAVIGGSQYVGEIDLYDTYYAYHNLSAIKALQGKYKEAYALEHRGSALLDSLKTREKTQSFYNFEYQSHVVAKDKQIAREQLRIKTAENKLQKRNLLTAVAGGGLFLIILVLFSFYRNSRNKQKLQRKEIDAIQQEQEIGNLKAMIKGEEKERARIARDLHDGIMVQLSTVKMKIQSLPEAYRSMNSAAYVGTDYYRSIVTGMDEASRELRKTAHNLMPDLLLKGGLGDAVTYFCKAIQQSTSLNITFQQLDEIEELLQEQELSIYRIIQELMQNILKHAAATHVLIQLACPRQGLLTLTVEDNGGGFDPATAHGKGMGLKGISSRVQVMKGSMDIHSAPGKGTSVYIEVDTVSSQQRS